MTLQMLEYFVALAERKSFTDAANACFVSQPALSRAIAGLEKELGCTIVERGKNVSLTPAGEVLYTEAKRILPQMDTMLERVRATMHGVHGTILLGYIAYGMLQSFRHATKACLQDMRNAGVRLETVYDSAPEIKRRLLSGELDGAILPENCVWNLPHCRTCETSRQRNKLMIPKEHPLFSCESISMKQLKDSKFVFFSPDDMPMVFAKHVHMCRDAGFSPEIAGYGRKVGDVIDLMHQHGAVSIATCAFDYTESSDLRLVPIEEFYTSALVLVIREKNCSPLMCQLFEQIKKNAQQKNIIA